MPRADMRIPARLALTIALDDDKHGPKFMALPSDRMRRFVLAVLAQRRRNSTRSAVAAGYTGTKGALRVTAHRLAHDERIIAALHEEAKNRVRTGQLVDAIGVVDRILQNDRHPDQARVALSVLDRAGLHATTEHKVTVKHLGDDPAQVMRIKLLSERLGIDPAKLLGARLARLQPPTIDADAVAGQNATTLP